jgi:hypothetical protein
MRGDKGSKASEARSGAALGDRDSNSDKTSVIIQSTLITII